jgi:hypothetical protein
MKRFKSIVVAALAFVVAAAYTVPALPVSAASSSALSIVPKKTYTIESGKSVKDTLVIRNLDTNIPLQLTLRVIDFTFTDDGGTPKLFLAQDAPQTTWSLKPFLTIPKSVTIAPGGSKTLDMSIAIPAGHGAGSYYSAIVYSSGSGEGGNVGLSASGVTLAFVNVPGKVNEDLKLQKFGAYKMATANHPASYTFITTDMPEMLAYNLKNSGNVAEAPVGSITLKSMFGKEQTISNVNPNSSLALIGQSRTFTACIKLKAAEVEVGGSKSKSMVCDNAGLWPGRYTAKLDIFYGQNGNVTQEVVGTTSFWYLPVWFIILLIVVIAVLAFVIWRVVRIIRAKLYGHRPAKSHRRK